MSRLPKNLMDMAFGHLQGLPMKMWSNIQAMESLWWAVQKTYPSISGLFEELRRNKEALNYAQFHFQSAVQGEPTDSGTTFDMQIKAMLTTGKFLTEQDFKDITKEMLSEPDQKG